MALVAVILVAVRWSGGPTAVQPRASSGTVSAGVGLVHADSAGGEARCLTYIGSSGNPSEQLEAEYDVSAAGAVAWLRAGYPGVSTKQLPLATMTPMTALSFCYISGRFTIPTAGGTVPPDRIEVAVDPRGVGHELGYGRSTTYPARPGG